MKSILREKYRYVKFKITSAKEHTKPEFEKQLRQELLSILGEIEYSKCLPKIVSYSSDQGIIKILRDVEKDIRAALALITNFGQDKVHLQVTFVSGTLQGCKSKKE